MAPSYLEGGASGKPGALHPGFTTSTLLRKLNAGDYNAVPVELMKWINSGGRKVQGLVNRRAAEGGLWAKGEFVSSAYVEAAPQLAQTVTQSTEGKAAATAGIGVMGTALADAANQIAPYTSALPVLRWIFVALTIVSIGIGLLATIRRIQADNV